MKSASVLGTINDVSDLKISKVQEINRAEISLPVKILSSSAI
jgi:hypothetical protein